MGFSRRLLLGGGYCSRCGVAPLSALGVSAPHEFHDDPPIFQVYLPLASDVAQAAEHPHTPSHVHAYGMQLPGWDMGLRLTHGS